MRFNKNTRDILTGMAIWLGLSVVLFMIYAAILPVRFALMRSIAMILMMAFLHYGNTYIFRKHFVPRKALVFGLLSVAFIVCCSVIRYLTENYVMPMEAKPPFFLMYASRPFFYIITTAICWWASTIILYSLNMEKRERAMLLAINANNEARLQYLQSQINPHFLFNVLNNIFSLVVTKSDKAPDMFISLTELLRYSIYQKPGEKISVQSEAHQIELLIKLFNLKNDLPYNIMFEKKSIQGFIEPMILIPLVENCLKHADLDMNDSAYINIQIESDERGLRFATENTFAKKNTDEPGGVGLKNIQERLSLIYGDRHQLNIEQACDLFKVKLSLQWNQ